MSRLVALIAALALAAAGCSGGPSLEGISVKEGKHPSLTVPKNFAVDQTTTKVLQAGKGAKAKSGDTLKVDYVAVNGRTGKEFDSSFKTGQPWTIQLTKAKALPGFLTALKGQRVGTRLIAAIPPIDGLASERPEIGLKKSDTMVVYFDIRSKLAMKASGKRQALPADVPEVVERGGKPIGFRKTPSTPATLTASSAHVVIQGTGAKVPKDGTVVAHYLGQEFPDGAVFDQSWTRGAPATFPLSSVVKCWKDLLPGVSVGSRVVLECTAADAYGDNPPAGSQIKPGEALLFVVDVLEAS